MTFAFPWGLLGLLSLPAILILHLLRQRLRKLVVSDLRLWSWLETEAHTARLQRIPITWLLLLDLLIAALLSLALARPRLTADLPWHGARHDVILLDVSSSMLARDGVSTRFDQARGQALGLLHGLGGGDVATVIAFGSRPHLIGDTRQESLGQLIEQVSALQAGETGHALLDALALGAGALDPKLPVQFHVLTDGAYAALPAGTLENFAYAIDWRLVGGTAGNQAVVELNATPLGNNNVQVFARVANFSRDEARRDVILSVDGKQLDRATLQIPAESAVPRVWSFQGSPAQVTVALEGSDAFSQDDSAAIGLQAGGRVRVALVTDHPAPLQQAVRAIPGADLQVIAPDDYLPDPARPADLTIFRGYLPQTLPAGLVLLVEPPQNAGTGVQTALLSAGKQSIAVNAALQVSNNSPLLEGVDFGGVRWTQAWRLAETPDGFTALLSAGQVPLVLSGEVASGGVASHNTASSAGEPATAGVTRLVVLLADLNKGNFTRHPAFPILIGNLVRSVHQSPLPASARLGQPIRLPAPGDYRALRVTAPDGQEAQFGADWPAAYEQTLQPGAYRFEFQDAAGQTTAFVAGVNAGDETESDLRPRAWVQASGRGIGAGANGANPDDDPQREKPFIELMPWLLGAAALALLLETRLAWRPS